VILYLVVEAGLRDLLYSPLPVVVAKGEGALARRMIQIAREEGMPILQNIPLARILTPTRRSISTSPRRSSSRSPGSCAG
jgi:hypothetical protein